MTNSTLAKSVPLPEGATVAVIGGGPAGSFFAIHLLREARALKRNLRVIIFERRQPSQTVCEECWKGCNYCAGGISPKLSDVLTELGLKLPEEIIQCHIKSITVQGFWKNIEMEVPEGREMLSVFRGSRPSKRQDWSHNFDYFMAQEAAKAGAVAINEEVTDVRYSESGKPIVCHEADGTQSRMEADLVVFAAGVNEQSGIPAAQNRLLQTFQRLVPDFRPPHLRRALIFELEAKPKVPENLAGTLHFVEYGSKTLRIEMCSLVPKKGFITVVLVGESVDAAVTHEDDRVIMQQFLELPHIRKLIPPGFSLKPSCLCRPNMVVGSAIHSYGERVAAVGDIVTARLYKDGILSAHQTAKALAQAVLDFGIDSSSIGHGYEPTLHRFRRNNGFASVVFFLHRVFFGSSALSRVLYQAAITERKTTPSANRRLEKIIWRIASGDDEYGEIFWSMANPATMWAIFWSGAVITARNYLTEQMFGLKWEGFGRFTTGVALERLNGKRIEFSRLIHEAGVSVPRQLEFERMYTIKIRASQSAILDELGRFGEPDRGYFKPRWVQVRRISGIPHEPGCVIRYEILNHNLSFSLEFEQLMGGHMAVYRVMDGYAKGGVLIFEIEKLTEDVCALSIYVAFDFARGNGFSRPLWWLFRHLFPAYVHDVIWNHSLCQLKDIVEAVPDITRT